MLAERIKWFNQARKKLKLGKVPARLDDMTTLNNNASGENRKIMTSQINYITKSQLDGRLNYAKISDQNLPRFCGAVESLIRQAVNLRLKGNGKFWLKENAETLLHARCQWLAGEREQFLRFYLECSNQFGDDWIKILLKSTS